MRIFSVVVSLAALTSVGSLACQAASVTFEAESGMLDSDWAVSNSSSPAYITILTDGAGYNPGSAARVATYTVTFPTAGTYQLYARLRTGSGTYNDDSLFYANSFGSKSPTNNSDWTLANGLAGVGFSNSTDVVTGGGTLGSGMWKWINLSQFAGNVSFTVRTLYFLGAPNSTNVIQVAGSLTPPIAWQNVATNVADSGGAWQFTDSMTNTVRFYRSYAR